MSDVNVVGRSAGRKAVKGLIRAVLPFLIVISIQTVLASASVGVLSAVRAYVGGESLWTKGQKDAIYRLSLYAQTGNEADYRLFETALSVPLGDRAARRALERSPADVDSARLGFLAGGNDPDDVPGMIFLFLHARDISFFRDAVEKWRATDEILDEFVAVGKATREDVSSGLRNDLPATLERIAEVDARMTPLAVAFSQSLGAGSRRITALLIGAHLLVGGLLLALITWRARLDIRQKLRFQRAWEVEKERAAATLAEIGEAVFRIDGSGVLRYVNPAGQALVGTGASMIGRRIGEALTLIDLATGAPLKDLAQTILTGGETKRERRSGLALVRRSLRIPVTLVSTQVANEDGAPGAVLVLHDMSREQEMIDRLGWLAAHDHLTGLPNRREFERVVDAMLSGARAAAPNAIALVDLDQFKLVNDTGGHAAGDALLRHVAESLRRHVRSADFVARLGGDEFGLLLFDCPPDEAFAISEDVRASLLAAAFDWEGKNYTVTASIGLVTLAPGLHAAEPVLHAADAACYLAKARGRNRTEWDDDYIRASSAACRAA
jgi:diguanylate cyclase (GGDEF)-like protein